MNRVFFPILALVIMSVALMPNSLAADPATEPTPARDCISQVESGMINWSSGVITVWGHASPRDNRKLSQESVPGAARADASKGLIRILKQIKITPSLSVAEYADNNDVILAGIEKTARDAVSIRQHYTSDLAVKITIHTGIMGGFLQLVLPDDIRQIPGIKPQQRSMYLESDELYTGLVIDARELGIEPVLNPVIISEQGHRVYSSEFISRDFAVKNGVCKYLCSMDAALTDPRVGRNPLSFKGLRKEGGMDDAIVISMSDYRQLEKITERHMFLKECRVILVKD